MITTIILFILAGLLALRILTLEARDHKSAKKFRKPKQLTTFPKLDSANNGKRKVLPKFIDAEAQRKGYAFEKFIVTLFNQDDFILTHWRSDKTVDNIFPEEAADPDLELLYCEGFYETEFAVECKWRKDYFNDGIEWAKDYQFDNYNIFSEDLDMGVFIIIGVGGTPEKPNDVFVIPLDEIDYLFLYKSVLNKYKRSNPYQPFQFDLENMRLF